MSVVAADILRELSMPSLMRGSASSAPGPARWELPALTGCLTELSGRAASATLTAAFGLVLDAQQRGEPVAWLTLPGSTFYPPDALAAGVDLEALVVIRMPEIRAILRAAAHLARSGAFGLLVIDLEASDRVPVPTQTLLVGHARKHNMAILFLTRKKRTAPSLGSLVAVRGEAVREHLLEGEAFVCRVEILKDKRRGPGWNQQEICHGPDGLC